MKDRVNSWLLAMAVAAAGGNALAQGAGAPTNIGPGVSRVGAGVGGQSQKAVDADAQRPSAPAPQQGAPLPSQYQGGGIPAPNLVNEAIDRVRPLNPEELTRLRRELEARAEAETTNVSGRPPARPTTVVFNLDLSPGATPAVVRVELGQGSIVSFLDAAGRPWPARVADNFAPKGITVSQFTEHQLSVSANRANPVNGIVAVALEGLPVAITFSVVSGQPIVDTQAHMVVPQYRNGPPAAVGALRGEPSLTAGDLMSYLLRTPPPSARKLAVEGLPGAMAWQVAPARMVLRTNAMVTTGAFRVQGLGDGTYVYELPLSPQVRVVMNDQFKAVRISGFIAGGA